ncbi:MAG: hypothetical protein MJZ60_05030 [Bacteroidaceae bacterium]|nr:hypothetical protein [Bacteroidaceae bacterium]
MFFRLKCVLFCLVMCMGMMAQSKFDIKGIIIDNETSDPMEGATVFDILHQQTNISRSVNAFSRTDSHNNAIYQYAMFSAIFRFSVYGGKNTMGTDKEKK